MRLTIKGLLCLLLLLTACSVYSQNKKTNLETFEEQISEKLERIVLSSGLNVKDNALLLTITSAKESRNEETPEEVKFLTNITKKIAATNNIRYYLSEGTQTSDTNIYKVYIKANELKTGYNGFKKNKFLGEKTMNRNIKADVNVFITSTDGTPLINETITVNHNDEIPYDEYDSYESSQFQFTQGTPPKVGAFENLFFPVLLVAASAAAILAFFIIRTK